MTQKERLANLLDEFWLEHYDACNTDAMTEHLLSNGVIVPLCKVGDMVYIIPSKVNYDLNQQFGRQADNRVYVQVIDEIRFNLNGYYIVTTVNDLYAGAYNKVSFHDTWFLSSEEAEQALKERKTE